MSKKEAEDEGGDSTIGKYIRRFRNSEPKPRNERGKLSSDFWWVDGEVREKSNINNSVEPDTIEQSTWSGESEWLVKFKEKYAPELLPYKDQESFDSDSDEVFQDANDLIERLRIRFGMEGKLPEDVSTSGQQYYPDHDRLSPVVPLVDSRVDDELISDAFLARDVVFSKTEAHVIASEAPVPMDSVTVIATESIDPASVKKDDAIDEIDEAISEAAAVQSDAVKTQDKDERSHQPAVDHQKEPSPSVVFIETAVQTDVETNTSQSETSDRSIPANVPTIECTQAIDCTVQTDIESNTSIPANVPTIERMQAIDCTVQTDIESNTSIPTTSQSETSDRSIPADEPTIECEKVTESRPEEKAKVDQDQKPESFYAELVDSMVSNVFQKWRDGGLKPRPNYDELLQVHQNDMMVKMLLYRIKVCERALNLKRACT